MISSILSNNVSVQILPANSAREHIIIINESSTTLYVAFSSSASVDSYAIKLEPGDFYESSNLIYTGVISGVWSGSPSGYARITEV